MKNPFKFGIIVRGEYFADREEELKTLVADIESGQNIIIYSPRRYGKTSLIKKVGERLSRDIIFIYVDLYSATSLENFISLYSNALLQTAGKAREAVAFVSDFLKKIFPVIKISVEDVPKLEVGFSKRKDDTYKQFLELLDVPEKIAEKKGKRVVVVFDEFQEVSNLNGDQILRDMRSKIQGHEHTSYVFMGSKQHLFEDIFMNEDNPMFRIGKVFPLEKIGGEDFARFIVERFKVSGVECSRGIADEILKITGGHPAFTQQLAYETWNIASPRKKVKPQDVSDAAEVIIAFHELAFDNMYDSLTASQKKMLFAIASEGVSAPYTREFMERWDFSYPSVITKTLTMLQRRGIVDKSPRGYEIKDVFLKEWLIRKHLALK